MSRKAFTFVEMVVALVLGTLLLGVMTSAIRRSLIELKSLTEDPRSIHTSLLTEQLERDLTNARQIIVGPNQLDLMGFLHRDPRTLISTMRPAWVRYEIRRNGSHRLLVRVQSVVANGAVLESLSEPVAAHVGSIVVSADVVGALVEADRIGQPDLQLTPSANQNLVPASVRILMIDVRGRTILDHIFRRMEGGP